MELLQQQEQFIGELLDGITEPWERIEVHYENFAWGDEHTEIYVANRFLDGQQTDVDLSLEALDTLASLKAHRPDGQDEPWTWLTFTLDAQGHYHFSYQYGVPPYVAREIEASKD
ncbi:MAG TPA: hypothetical protein H9903_09045 [Candidatus Aquabacterium excrementipullorum]|nr:hypothetical protein [Candidatus Aquabacterium excrementipullorum]